MLELWLIRHGETDWNREARFQGRSDVPLNEYGLRQAEHLGQRIATTPFDKVVSSDLQRTAATARVALPAAEVVLEPRLREIDMGEFEGRYLHEITSAEWAQIKVWHSGPFDQKVPGGESGDDLRYRLVDWLGDLPTAGRVAAFSHGGTISGLLQSITGRPYDTGRPGAWSFRLANTSITKLLIENGHTIISVVNDHAHLEGANGQTEAG
ncbi:MAG: histidine phosphatase family protein [Trueperaceae bacterium]|nr:MAG: histidine phosphatase family protein [Trueperaceae bacterium]